MTKADLIALLADFPDDTPILDGRGQPFNASFVRETTWHDWQHTTTKTDADGRAWEEPARKRAVTLGLRRIPAPW